MIEFAIVCPLLISLVFGIVAYGYLYGIYSSIQQVTAEAARASIAGIDDAERDTLARSSVATNLGSYTFLESARLSVSTNAIGTATPGFQVQISYDLSASFLSAVPLLPMPQSPLVLSAAVQRGGY